MDISQIAHRIRTVHGMDIAGRSRKEESIPVSHYKVGCAYGPMQLRRSAAYLPSKPSRDVEHVNAAGVRAVTESLLGRECPCHVHNGPWL